MFFVDLVLIQRVPFTSHAYTSTYVRIRTYVNERRMGEKTMNVTVWPPLIDFDRWLLRVMFILHRNHLGIHMELFEREEYIAIV